MSVLKNKARKLLAPWLYGQAYTRASFTQAGIALQELRVTFRQFFNSKQPVTSSFRCVKYSGQALLRFLAGRSLRFSYGYTGEDRIIESLLKPIITRTGFYVDVGCNDPRFISNTFLLYKRGWKGICIDPNKELIEKYKKIRPRDFAICALISETESTQVFTEFKNPVLSSADPEHVKKHKKLGEKILDEKLVKARTLTSVLDEAHAPSQFELLSIDAEENDFEVLKSLDFSKYQPTLVVVEAEDLDPTNPQKNRIYSLMESKGYIFQGSILKNAYFIKSS